MIIKTIKFMYYYNNGNISKFERLVFSGIQKKNYKQYPH